MATERICPTCLRPFKPEDRDRRICRRCRQPILKHHKFRFVKSQVEHRNCADPKSYKTEEAAA